MFAFPNAIVGHRSESLLIAPRYHGRSKTIKVYDPDGKGWAVGGLVLFKGLVHATHVEPITTFQLVECVPTKKEGARHVMGMILVDPRKTSRASTQVLIF